MLLKKPHGQEQRFLLVVAQGHGGRTLCTWKCEKQRQVTPGVLGLCWASVLNSTLPRKSLTHSAPQASGFLHVGLDEQPTWPQRRRAGATLRPCSERAGCRQSPWPPSGGLSWPKRDRYNSVLEDKQNKLLNILVNFPRLKKELS